MAIKLTLIKNYVTKQLNETNRIVVDLIELRVMKNEQSHWCEIFESGEWNRISATKLHQLSFDKTIYEWLNQHYNSTRNQKIIGSKNESLGLSNRMENRKKPQVLLLLDLLRNFLLKQEKSREV